MTYTLFFSVFLIFLLSFNNCASTDFAHCTHGEEDVIQRFVKKSISRPVKVKYASSSTRDHKLRLQEGKVRNIRIVTDFGNIEDPSMYCSARGDVRSSFMDGSRLCRPQDVLTREKRLLIMNDIVPRAIEYISEALLVVPTEGNITAGGICPDWGFKIPEDHKKYGVEGDSLIYITAVPTRPSVYAWASTCALNQYGVPIVGLVNLSPADLFNGGTTMWRVFAHELLHALGFTPSVWKESRLSRCLQTTEIRRGKLVTILRGPATIAVARQYFNCPTLTGVELEDAVNVRAGPAGESRGTAGAHWKAKYHRGDMMEGWIGQFMYLSPLTLALMQDLGFYAVNWSKAEIPTWMKGMGCETMHQKCSLGPSTGDGVYFCFSKRDVACVPDRLSVGSCDIVRYANPGPPAMSYFIDNRLGGRKASFDYCPIYEPISGGRCTVDRPFYEEGISSRKMGFMYGEHSRCYEVQRPAPWLGPDGKITNGRCFETSCVETSEGELKVSFRPAGVGHWFNCSREGEIFDLRSFGFEIEAVCPNPRLVCTMSLAPKGPDSRLNEIPQIEYVLDSTGPQINDTCPPVREIPWIEPSKRALSPPIKVLMHLMFILFMFIFY